MRLHSLVESILKGLKVDQNVLTVWTQFCNSWRESSMSKDLRWISAVQNQRLNHAFICVCAFCSVHYRKFSHADFNPSWEQRKQSFQQEGKVGLYSTFPQLRVPEVLHAENRVRASRLSRHLWTHQLPSNVSEALKRQRYLTVAARKISVQFNLEFSHSSRNIMFSSCTFAQMSQQPLQPIAWHCEDT